MASPDESCNTSQSTFRFFSNFPVIDGVLYFPETTREFLQGIKHLPVKGDEVFVATYPKTGNDLN
jgi:hypothetical protein